MIKILILDVYPSDNWRLVKDTAGGYGTGNDFGSNFLGKIMNFFVSKTISMPPMSAMYIFSILKNKRADVEYTKKIDAKISIKDYDFVIMPSSIISHETEVKELKRLTSLGIKVFVIGIFANVKKDAYHMKNAFIIPGEPESFFLEIDLKKENLKKYFDNESKSYFGKPFVNNLDDLPFPSWDDYLKKYNLRNNFLSFNSKDAIPIVATRGCPYSCFSYCTYPLQQGRKVRFRSVDNVVNEIKHWIKLIGAEKFVFRDPVFSINRKYTVSLCNEIINQNLKIEFLIESHLNNLDEELIELLYRSGLKLIYIGIESADSEVLKDNKRFTIEKDTQYQLIKKLENKGIMVKSMFMLANPEDNEQTTMDTIKYSKLLPNQLVQFSVFTPYPGTPIFKKFENDIVTNKMENFNQYNLVYKHKIFDEQLLNKYKQIAYKNFYFNIKNLLIIFKTFISIFRK